MATNAPLGKVQQRLWTWDLVFWPLNTLDFCRTPWIPAFILQRSCLAFYRSLPSVIPEEKTVSSEAFSEFLKMRNISFNSPRDKKKMGCFFLVFASLGKAGRWTEFEP